MSKLDGSKGKISKEFSFGSVESRLELPPGLSEQHRILLITVALEVVSTKYLVFSLKWLFVGERYKTPS